MPDRTVVSKNECTTCHKSHTFVLGSHKEDKEVNGDTHFCASCSECHNKQFIPSEWITWFTYKQIEYVRSKVRLLSI